MLLRRRGIRLASTATKNEYPITTLENGIKVVTSPYPSHFAGMGVYISAGSRFEPPDLWGVSHIIDRLSFKSTSKRSQEEMEQKLLTLGGNYTCSSSRETMMYQASTFHSDFPQMVELIAETINSPAITPEEVKMQVHNAGYEIDEIWQNPELILPEIGHQTAFKGGLGNPLLCPADRLELMTPGLMWQYRYSLYRPSRMTLGFLGVPHARSVEMAEQHFGYLKDPADSVPIPSGKSEYIGGERTIPMPRPIGNLPQFNHCQVLYRGVGINDPDVYAVATLQTLLGGGGSFSAGGPGKGMYSRLYTQVLNQYGYVESCQSVNHSYSDDGLFGITCAAIPQAAEYISYIIGSQLALLFQPGQLTSEDVSRAKNQLRSQLLMNLEARMVELEDAGRQVQLNGHKMAVQEMVSNVDRLTIADLQRAAERVLTGSEPTVVMQGPRESFGDVQKVLAEFGLGTK